MNMSHKYDSFCYLSSKANSVQYTTFFQYTTHYQIVALIHSAPEKSLCTTTQPIFSITSIMPPVDRKASAVSKKKKSEKDKEPYSHPRFRRVLSALHMETTEQEDETLHEQASPPNDVAPGLPVPRVLLHAQGVTEAFHAQSSQSTPGAVVFPHEDLQPKKAHVRKRDPVLEICGILDRMDDSDYPKSKQKGTDSERMKAIDAAMKSQTNSILAYVREDIEEEQADEVSKLTTRMSGL
ncbi:hypothetical protein K491DRAFT_66273 [Lophiostoma macrostomum CBS 122681]|uniref:Uncharacterized protein n=1 Tax=Lophiostoma macrostomum CBS 122681 TaxID=1314788 RepID=A0A6A6SZZ9_9PLEO|nr:hypothetical protein K491DRAFT_66273 [Lophiostoma macrostomum CBS 122681]